MLLYLDGAWRILRLSKLDVEIDGVATEIFT